MGRKTMLKIDPERLQERIAALPPDEYGRRITMADVSRRMGLSTNYFSKAIKRGSLPYSVTVALDSLFDIKKEDYIAEDDEIDAQELIREIAERLL